MHSLRARLILVAVLVAAIAVLVSVVFSRQVLNTEFRRYVSVGSPVDLGSLQRELESMLREGGTLEAAAPAIARAAARVQRTLLLADSSGRTLASSSVRLRSARVRVEPGGNVSIEEAIHSEGARGIRVQLTRAPQVPVRDAAGRVVANVLVLPEAQMPGPPSSFLRRVNVGVWQGALAAMLIGGALAWVLAGRMLGPIEQLTAAARRMEGGDLSARVAATGRDEVATLAHRFNAMAESLGRSFQLRRQLTHDVAHELRTPLTNLRAHVEALQDGLLAASPETLASLHEEVMLLSRLVADLEQLAEAESGALRLDLADLDAAGALAGAAAAFAPLAAERGVAVDVAAASGLMVRADDMRLAQILRNLVANAITHTPAGGRVTLSAVREDARVALTVADTGEGIAPEHLAHVFDRFYRADPSRSRASGGAGLGLAIVQQLALAHGGDVRAESEPGRGTRITVRLPAAGS